MSATDIIAKKREGCELSSDEIAEVVRGSMAGTVSEAQLGALLMAIFLRGLTDRETADLTLAMTRSGDVLDLSSIPEIKVDKHSTGGVGDKTTLVVAPLVAALGVPVPKMSGRALGHTGGTIDKLECLPGLTTRLSPDRFCRQVAELGMAIASQSERLAPADGRIYALRDATATVESLPLIASSVMSKKLAVGADALVLDVKAGRGAFMADAASALELARLMVEIGRRADKQVVAVVTRMEQPLGEAVGDVIELQEAVATLKGEGSADFVQLCEVIAGHMLALGGKARDPEEGKARAKEGLRSGAGLRKLEEVVQAQGGAKETLDDLSQLLQGTTSVEVRLSETGYVTALDARQVGVAVRELKANVRERHHQCGVRLRCKQGDPVGGEAVAEVLGPEQEAEALERAAQVVRRAYQVGPVSSRPGGLVLGVVPDG